MTKRISSSYAVIATLALAAAPAMAAGEGEPQAQQPSQGQEGQQQQGQEGQQQQGAQITKKINVNEKVSFPVAGGCQYTANVNGTIAPAHEQEKGREKGKEQPQGANQLSSDLRVNAQVTCPNKATLRVEDTITRTGPMSPDALEHAIERRATVVVEQAGTQCAFMPDFQLGKDKLTGTGVAYLCATRTQDQGQGAQGSM